MTPKTKLAAEMPPLSQSIKDWVSKLETRNWKIEIRQSAPSPLGTEARAQSVSGAGKEIEENSKNGINSQQLEAFEPIRLTIDRCGGDHADGDDDGGDFEGMEDKGHCRRPRPGDEHQQRCHEERDLSAGANGDTHRQVHSVFACQHHCRRMFGGVAHDGYDDQAYKEFRTPDGARDWLDVADQELASHRGEGGGSD